MERLPIDEFLPAIAGALAAGHLVIEAEPGAGKTTRVPPALLDRPGEIWVTEPRRLAARMAAARVASERGEAVGGTVGYQVRFEQKASAATRIRFVTEGILLRRLAGDPDLRGVGTVVFDEFHERNLDGDVGLALCRQIAARRPEFRIAVMSATLLAEPVRAFLGACGHVKVPGRQYPVTIAYDTRHEARPLEIQVRAAVQAELRAAPNGHVLVFVPGVFEIGKCIEALTELGAVAEMLPLHGGLSPAEQDRAVRPSQRRKVIVSTNVAESSVTIDGVVAVVDSGLVRVASHSPWSGLPVFRTEPTSRASADQRAGRAGRTGPGRAVRLYGERQDRPVQPLPEILQADLAPVALELLAIGINPADFGWFEAPRAAALPAAMTLLAALGAVEGGRITAIGKKMAALPLHPRLARLVVTGDALGVGRDALIAAALLSESDGRFRRRGPAEIFDDSDVTHAVDAFETRDLDGRTRRAVETLLSRLDRDLSRGDRLDGVTRDEKLRQAVLAAFPDRVARRRESERSALVLANGQTATIDAASVVTEAELMVVVDAEERHGRVWARVLSAIEAEWLLEEHAGLLRDESQLVFDPVRERIEAVSRLSIGAVVLDESRRPPNEDEAVLAAGVLARAAAAAPRGLGAFVDLQALHELLHRISFAAGQFPERGLPALSIEDAGSILASACSGATSFAELRDVDLLGALRAQIEAEHGGFLRRAAPEHVDLLGGRRVPIHYEPGKPPWIESRLQDFFGMMETPRVAEGRVPLTVHLLAPNQRALQVTSDLGGFWDVHYPALKKQLERRYPRHAWPDNPKVAQPAMKKRK